ncbi:tRNA dihydrouridine(20/20a) synthase DusA [Pseudidiomarina insulisalsae]|uniref:tRNA-dihydrouridine(20/20a) synthase n=1 Tax=Pseudidiomarina insulisalsae TaxID=575789 RepID=A0A432YHV4_9GAMM|nr:tRNA dihydrouridine(20/20a) synthase DusA [Pseudidiomarina insulisalsae]RUO60532.1 tRNA dihydrouridine(20/20a) synthase DusA [Pseudidiomarina insulisalsae]
MASTLTAPTLAVAPMLDWTDRHCRYFHRLFTKKTVLFTEMVTTGAIIHGKYDFLAFHPAEQPVVLQLGGSDPAAMAECAARAFERGYEAVDINVGCPSDRVKNGSFGACLMAEPAIVGACVEAMQKAAPQLRVSVKTRLGIDEHDSDAFLYRFIDTVTDAGCRYLTLHARKAWLQGLSPKQNREIPPLQYERVYQAKQRYPGLHLMINGGITDAAAIATHLQHVDGVMVGREAYQNPAFLGCFDTLLADTAAPMPQEMSEEMPQQMLQQYATFAEQVTVVEQMIPYTEAHLQQGGRCWHVVRHMLGLFQGQPGAKRWRQWLSQQGPTATNAEELIRGGLAFVLQERAKLDQKLAEQTNE